MNINTRWVRLGLSLVGVAGVGVTSVLSVKCHEKAKDKTEKKEKLAAYIPAIASGVLTSACILGSHKLSSKQIAALTASCGYLAANRKKFEEVVQKNFGKEKANEMRKVAATEAMKEENSFSDNACYEHTGRGRQKFLFFDQDRYFISDMPSVIDADRKFNHDISMGLVPAWNDYFKYLHIHSSKDGEELVIPANYVPNHSDLESPVKFDYVSSENNAGEEVILIFVDTIETPLLAEYD